jgi:hypothetical protein
MEFKAPMEQRGYFNRKANVCMYIVSVGMGGMNLDKEKKGRQGNGRRKASVSEQREKRQRMR